MSYSGAIKPIKIAKAFACLPRRSLAEGISHELIAQLDALERLDQEAADDGFFDHWDTKSNGGTPPTSEDPNLEPGPVQEGDTTSSESMLAAALGWAEAGWAIFPAPPGEKKSYKSAKYSGGARWGATRDPEQVRRDFQRWPNANIGVPTGKDNATWVLEADTLKGHNVDGIASLRALEEKYGPLPPTLMAESPSGSLHYYFDWPKGVEIRNSASVIGPGIDVRGEGGMVLAPPSVRGDGEYRWIGDDNDIAEAPQWLVDLAVAASRSSNKGPDKGMQQPPRIKISPLFANVPVRNLGDGIVPQKYPPQPLEPILAECGWLRHVHATGGSDQSEILWRDALRVLLFVEKGEDLIHEFSRRHAEYDEEKTEAKFARARKDKEANDLGNPKCQTICDHGSEHCKTCPHLDAGGSPLHLALDASLAAPEPEPPVVPRDLWAKFEAPPLPTGLLPEAIEKFAFAQAELMGCDPAGIAMGALTVCAAAIPDEIKLQVKQHDPRWQESTRLWTGLVGPPSTMKSPIMLRAIDPLKHIDNRSLARYMEAMAAYERLPAEQQSEKPKLARIMLGDTTPEAAQLVLQDNPNGVMLFRDELSGWFGSMDKYSGHRGAASDRGFWLQSFNGGQYYVDRVTRRSGSIPNLSVSILGGIQVEPLRALVAEGVDDGLIQRIFPIMLRPAVLGKDEPLPADQYDNLVERLNERPCRIVRFDAAAQQIRRKLESKHIDLAAYESVNKKLAAHIGKYNGLFARLCLLWHCIETVDTTNITSISYIDADTAQRVADFMHGFLLPHAISFYVGVVGLADDHDRLANVAGYILAHKLERITPRDIARGDRSMRKLDRQDTDSILHRLDALGWISRVQGRRFSDVQWVVNPEVHRLFEERAKAEAYRRQRERDAITAAYEVTQRRGG